MKSFLIFSVIVAGRVAVRADDFESPGVLSQLDRQLRPYGLPGWYALPTVRSRMPPKDAELSGPESPEVALKRTEMLNRKLDVIRLPQVRFENTIFRDAVAWLREAARQQDRESGASSKGVVLVNKLLAAESDFRPAVTLHLTDVSLREVLEKMLSPLGLTMVVTPSAVELRRP